MANSSKFISGLKSVIEHPNSYFNDTEKHQIIQDYLSSGGTKQEIWEKYTGQKEEHGYLLRWMRKLGYADTIKSRGSNFVSDNSNTIMTSGKASDDQPFESFETLQLKKRISELEARLRDAEMKAIAFSTMVDIAEDTFNISIRKKYNTKPSKK